MPVLIKKHEADLSAEQSCLLQAALSKSLPLFLLQVVCLCVCFCAGIADIRSMEAHCCQNKQQLSQQSKLRLVEIMIVSLFALIVS